MSNLRAKFSSILRRCCVPKYAVKPGQQTHTQILTNNLLFNNTTLYTDLILLYSRCSLLPFARKLFDEMSNPTLRSYNILISSYTRAHLHSQSLPLFSQFLSSNLIPDSFTLPPVFKSCGEMGCVGLGVGLHCWVFRLGYEACIVVMTSIVDMYVKFGCVDDALKVFDEMVERDVVVWSSIISGFVRGGFVDEAMGLVWRLRFEEGKIDLMVVPSVLSACGKSGELRRGKEVHGRVIRCLVFCYDVVINNSLIEMYAKCGCLDASHKVFLVMGDRQNLITWSTLISCYGVHGKGKEALALYDEMIQQGLAPNSITFTSILSSCSHSGLVNEGQSLFDLMKRDYGLEPCVEHYACIVDLLGRAGRITEALKLINSMPMKPIASIWGALLNACAMHCNVEVGEVAAYKLFELEPRNSSNYITLCGIYESVGILDNVATMRVRMRELGMTKTPGCSWIHMKGRMQVFYQGDVYCPSERVFDVLDGLCKIMAMRSLRDTNHKLTWLEGS